MALTSRQKQARRLWKMRALGLGYEDGGGGGGGIALVGASVGTANVAATMTLSVPGTPLEGDLIIAFYVDSTTVDQDIAVTGNNSGAYTEVTDLTVPDSSRTNFGAFYKIQGATPDTSIDFGVGTADADTDACFGCVIYRGVDTTTPMDVTPVTDSGFNTPLANPPSITPVTAGALIVAAGASGHNNGIQTFSSSDLTERGSTGAEGTFREGTLFFGDATWTSGAFDPAQFAFTGTNSTQFAWAAVTMALRPAT